MDKRHWWQRVTVILAAVAFVSLVAALAAAADYVVTFRKETYKAQPADQGGEIYHTWSVASDFGNKLLVLTGKDNQRRQWLREFSKENTLFLLTIPDKSEGAFEINKVFEIDVDAIHPIDDKFMDEGKKKKKRR